MSLTTALKQQIDLPMFEWMRPLPATNHLASCFTTANAAGATPYIYYIVSGALYRYDTEHDAYQQLANPFFTPLALVQAGYSATQGYYGRVISGYSSGLEIAGLNGQTLVGQTIKIIYGLGAGQERTITYVSDPIIKERGVVTTASTFSVADASTLVGLKQFDVNLYRDHQVRIDYGGGANQIRQILYNSYNTLTIYDSFFSSKVFWWGGWLSPTTSATAGSQSLYQVESHLITVNSNWNIIPDSSSHFLIKGGGMWATSARSTTPFVNFAYYNVLGDVWYNRSFQSGLLLAQLATDASFERFTEAGGAITSGIVLSGSSNQLFVSGGGLGVQRWNNFELRITSGSGLGQTKTILANNSGFFTTTDNWNTIPSPRDVYEVYRDCGKLMMVGNAQSTIYQYSQDSDMWTTTQQYRCGVVNNCSCYSSGDIFPFGIVALDRLTSGMTALSISDPGCCYKKNQILSLVSGSNGFVRIINTNESGGVTQVRVELPGEAYPTGIPLSSTVTPAGGTGCLLTVLGVSTFTRVNAFHSHSFKVGETVWITGVEGINNLECNGNHIVTGSASASANFYFSVTGLPDALIVPDLINASGIPDKTKSWTSGTLSGKLVQLSYDSGLPAQARLITGNNSNTLFVSGFTTVPVNGLTKYAICSPKPFGTEESIGSLIGSGNMGYASSGTFTSLTDTTKNWIPNYWSNTLPTGMGNSGRLVRIIEGTGAGRTMTITGNSNNTLYFSTQTFIPNESTYYMILDCFGQASTANATTLTDNNQNWDTNIWAGKRVRFIAGNGQGGEYPITSNTQTTLTFSTAAPIPDATTSYAILKLSPRGLGCHIDCIMNCSDANINNKYLYLWRGGGFSELSRYNIAKQTIEYLTPFPFFETLTTGSMFVYNGGDRIYFTKESTGRIMYYDIVKNTIVPCGQVPYGMGTACIGNRMEIIETEEGVKLLYLARHSGRELWRTILFP